MVRHKRQNLGASYRLYGNVYLINIHKNASMSIRQGLMRYGYVKSTHSIPPNGVKICVVRNPLERLLSSFFYIKRGDSVQSEPHHPINQIKKLDYFNETDLIKSFEGFTTTLEEMGLYSYILYPQEWFLSDKKLSISDIDYFLMQENLEDDFKKFAKKYKLPIEELPHINKSNSKDALNGNPEVDDRKTILIEYINNNKELFNRIHRLYKSDFEFYNEVKKINYGY